MDWTDLRCIPALVTLLRSDSIMFIVYAASAYAMHIKRPKATVVCFEGEKKAQKFSPPPAGETPDPCHLSGPEMISYT